MRILSIGIATVLSAQLTLSAQSFVNPLSIPSTISSTNIVLSVQNGTMGVYPGFVTSSIGFNGNYLGPTLLMNKGDSVNIQIINSLLDTTTVHWHGMHVSPQNDGGPHVTIAPQATWNPRFKVLDDASTHWYHSHLHMRTAEQVTKGMAGFIIVKDPAEAAINLPRTYGLDDVPMVFQSRAFTPAKQFDALSSIDSVMLINGTKNPYIQLPAQVVRLRLLNGSTMRAYNFGLSNNSQFFQIASDGGLLSSPVSLTRLMLAPGERAEILINLSGLQGQSLFLTNYGSEIPNGIYGAVNPAAMGMGTIPNYANNAFNGSNTHLIRLDVVAQTANAVTGIPANLVQLNPLNPANANLTRNLTFTPMNMGGGGGLNGPFVINGTPFDMMTINYTIPVNNIEIWSLTNNSPIAHPFHIHDVHYYILDINGMPPPPSLSGKKDVVLVRSQQTVRFIAQFNDFADEMYPYMYHCHMLLHEDEGMMGQFLVTTPATNLQESLPGELNITVFPNPNQGHLFVSNPISDSPMLHLELCDVQGKVLLTTTVSTPDQTPQKIDLSKTGKLAPGVYFIEFRNEKNQTLRKKLLVTE